MFDHLWLESFFTIDKLIFCGILGQSIDFKQFFLMNWMFTFCINKCTRESDMLHENG